MTGKENLCLGQQHNMYTNKMARTSVVRRTCIGGKWKLRVKNRQELNEHEVFVAQSQTRCVHRLYTAPLSIHCFGKNV